MLNAEDFIKNHSKAQKWSAGEKQDIAPKYSLKFYRSKNEIANEIGITRQTVAKRIWSLWFHMVEVGGIEYYVKDKDIIKFAFYLLNMK